MRILVTGISGRLGSALAPTLLSNHFDVVGLVHRHKIDLPLKTIKADLRDLNSLMETAKDFDVVLHLAGLTRSFHETSYFQMNYEGTKNLIMACQKNGISRIIYMSTRAIGSLAGAYGTSKSMAEGEFKKSSLDWTIVRPSEIYGLGGREGIERLIRACKNGKIILIPGRGNYLLNPIHFEDVIDVLLKILTLPKSSKKIYTLCGPKNYTYIELVNRFSSLFHAQPIRIFVPLILLKSFSKLRLIVYPDQVQRLICEKSSDITELVEDVGFKPKMIDEYFNENDDI